MRVIYLWSPIMVILTLFVSNIDAQVINDECEGAISLPIGEGEFCTAKAAFSFDNATPSDQEAPFCWPNTDTSDVWFTFINQGTDLNLRIIGNVTNNSGGSMTQPQMGLYSGSCSGGLIELGCQSDAFNTNIVEMYVNNLPLGAQLFLRVGSRNALGGTFQICANNFNLVPAPQSDCPSGVILCDKHPFAVEKVLGNGVFTNEIPTNGCIDLEFSSAWYRWTCETAGSFAFTITPSNPTDDIDFLVFELPGGLNDCANKKLLRCMAAGENVGQPFSTWQKCTGATGLGLNANDLQEAPGCASSSNNFVRYIDMIPDKVYALMIMNFSNSGNGFSINFSGTGTVKGPKADFEILPNGIDSTFCWDDTLMIIDQSSSSGGPIVEWNWVFGQNSVPAAANTPGDKEVWYQKSGTKTVLLSIKNDQGCIVSHTQTVTLECCNKTTIADAGPDGEIDLGDTYQMQGSYFLPGSIHSILWNPALLLNDATILDPICSTYNDITYELKVIDEFNCFAYDTVTIRVKKNFATFIPSGFSPNDDGTNDFLPVFTNRAGKLIRYMRIYDRWGSVLWEGRNLALNDNGVGWDGYSNFKRCNPGVYVYLAEVEYIDGTIILYSGDVTLVR
ncbi:MAG: gliding motility-associated C-terminal domain-containing protein [Saprospiraceae bacterium]